MNRSRPTSTETLPTIPSDTANSREAAVSESSPLVKSSGLPPVSSIRPRSGDILPRFNLIDVIGEEAVLTGVREAWGVARDTLKAAKTIMVRRSEDGEAVPVVTADHAGRMRAVEHIHNISGLMPSRSERTSPTGPVTINVQINYGIGPPQLATPAVDGEIERTETDD